RSLPPDKNPESDRHRVIIQSRFFRAAEQKSGVNVHCRALCVSQTFLRRGRPVIPSSEMGRDSLWSYLLPALALICAPNPATSAPQSAGTIYREGFDLQSCGERKTIDSRMWHAENAAEGQWPWHGGLYHLTEYQCGCTLINELFVVTASHCLYNADTGYMLSEGMLRVKLGMNLLSQNGSSTVRTFSVEKIIPHAKFVPQTHKHDVALLRLNGTVLFTNFIQPVCLDLTESIWVEYLADVPGTVVGWGRTEKNVISDRLLKAELPIVRYTDCVESNPELYGRLIYSGMYCAGILNGTSPCNGDSGGGMYIRRENRWFLRGVVSFAAIQEGTNYCDAFSYVVFMNLPYYAKWIETEVDAARKKLHSNQTAAANATVANRWDIESYEDLDESNMFPVRMEMQEEDVPYKVSQRAALRADVKKKSVRCGQDVTFSCRRPSTATRRASIRWFKVDMANGLRRFLIENETLTLHGVRHQDAGEYWCQLTSNTGTPQETDVQLTVTRVPIRFRQDDGTAYAVYDTQVDSGSASQFTFEMTFRAQDSDALLFHKPAKPNAESWEFSLAIERQRFALRIAQPGQLEKVCRSVKLNLSPDRWYTVLVSSYNGQGFLALDGQYLVGFEGHLLQHRYEQFFIAKSPRLLTAGFNGCVSRLMINDKVLDLERDFSDRSGVHPCEFCAADTCDLGQCTEGQQQSCINYACSDGRCDATDVSTPRGACDLGPGPYSQGLRFQNNSYASYRTFLNVELTVDLEFLPHGLTDGFIFHAAEHRRGFGKFITILMKAGRIELRFTTDAHLHTIYLESSVMLLTGRWYRLQAGFRDGDVYLQVNDEPEVGRSVLGTVLPTDRKHIVFLGGARWQGFINRQRDVKKGLDGCIKGIKLSRVPVDPVDDMVDSANVRRCPTE
uniref:Peptidase S1 domain-containing protein n=1 Tax=Anopheles dirus TaxID=7168 RepID=A0A182NLY8_9DIPT